jgi:hypothetical protein
MKVEGRRKKMRYESRGEEEEDEIGKKEKI